MITKFTPLEIEIILDRPDDVSPHYGGKVAATARRLIDKLEKLGVKFSYAERWY